MTNEEIRKALDEPTKASRKALAKVSLVMEADEPERYKEIFAKRDWNGEALCAYKAYRSALIFSRIAMILAVVIVIGSYLSGDFGMRLVAGWIKRYIMAIGIVIGMGLFAGGTLLLNNRKERLVAYAILEGM